MDLRAERLAKRRAYYRANRERVKAQNDRWNEKNRERKREQAREYMAHRRSNPAFVERERLRYAVYNAKPENKAKRRELFKKWCAENPNYNRDWQRKRNGTDPARYLHRAAKARAERAGIPFNIEISDITIPTHCPVLGLELQFQFVRGKSWASPSLDRKIPALGYVKGNVEVISLRANVLKSNGSATELQAVADYARRCESQ